MSFHKKIVVITGAAGGIGKETARQFAEEGARLCLVDLKQESIEEMAEELRLNKDNYIAVAADVSREENVIDYVKQTFIKFGTIDVFVNNAGIEGKVQPITETTDDNLSLVLNVNVKGVLYGMKHVLPVMMKNMRGSIINTASVAGFIGSPGMASYVASKHAVLGLTKTAALEAAEAGVRVNAVCPSPVDNRMMRSIEEGIAPGSGVEIKKQFINAIPLQRYALNEEIAQLILFLASDKSKFITGTAYRIDGGMAAK
ncbi:MAG: SDR family oxidoreductase [Firmicutes bacterium]|nr:SDR family oxidoreductase [Bacillota bacterium]